GGAAPARAGARVAYGFTLTHLPGGWLADRFGGRRVLGRSAGRYPGVDALGERGADQPGSASTVSSTLTRTLRPTCTGIGKVPSCLIGSGSRMRRRSTWKPFSASRRSTSMLVTEPKRRPPPPARARTRSFTPESRLAVASALLCSRSALAAITRLWCSSVLRFLGLASTARPRGRRKFRA